ncbi:YceI family protein [Komagataeibacter sp. FNDCF1]|uniref:YceI family protein n=1 Tax=Komagataeibacter sp. FNDCF1 TaxID=2878681 RepID=UPI001E6103DE|nr:YceI family protein [Komagataeibacter sp. FNDCF1]MCE2563640.1 YceI family protein [Komagataeibacter sp. FNDCF1]
MSDTDPILHRGGLWAALLLSLAPVALPSAARAGSQHLVLTPANTSVLLHADSIVGAMDGQFGKVSGTLDYDLSRQTCHVDLTMDATTVHMNTMVERQAAKSGNMLDSDRWPTARYVGDCSPRVVRGQVQSRMAGHMTMRGQTHPMTLLTQMVFTANTLTLLDSTGTFDGRQWGMSTMLHTVKPRMRTETRITLPNPPS